MVETIASGSPSPGTEQGDGGAPIIGDVVTSAPWHSTLTDEGLRTDPELTRYKTVEDLAKAHKELSGRPAGLQVPGKDARPEDWQAFYKQLPGYPAAPDKYGVKPPEMPEGAPNLPPEAFAGFLQVAHSKGLTDAQVSAMVEWWQGYNAEQWQSLGQSQQQQQSQGYDALRKTWGPLTDRNLTIATEGLRREFGPEGLGWLDAAMGKDASGAPQLLGNHPQLIQMAYELAMAKGHDRFVPGGRTGVGSPQEAQERIAQGRADLREGRISPSDFDALQLRYGPLAYSPRNGEDIRVGVLTGVDFGDEA